MGSGMNIQARHLTKSALQDIVEQLLSSDDETGRAIMSKLGKQARKAPPKNDLADLHEEMHGKYDAPMVQDDDEDNVSDDEASNDFDDDNGVQTSRVKGPPSKKPVKRAPVDEDVPGPRKSPRASPGDDEDVASRMPSGRMGSSRGDEDIQPRRRG